MDGGEIPSTGTGVARMLGIAPKKDREERIEEMKADHEKKKQEVAAMAEFHQLSRRVLVRVEIARFYEEKVAGHRRTKNAFADLSQKTAESLARIWGGVGAAHGYSATVE